MGKRLTEERTRGARHQMRGPADVTREYQKRARQVATVATCMRAGFSSGYSFRRSRQAVAVPRPRREGRRAEASALASLSTSADRYVTCEVNVASTRPCRAGPPSKQTC
jgi:hypothetical protein